MLLDRTKQLLDAIIGCAELLGLAKVDILAAKDYLDYKEYELCLDQIACQLYEYEIEVTQSFISLVDLALNKMKLPADTHSYLKELIKSKSNIPYSTIQQIDTIAKQHRQ